MEINIELLKAIKALAENPGATPYERKTAQRKLKQLLAKSGISLEELQNEEEDLHILSKIRISPIELTLASQVLGVVQNKNTVRCGFLKPKKKGRFYFWATPSQAIRFELLFPAYLKDYRNSLKSYMEAFIISNKLFPEEPPASETEIRLSQEEILRLHNLAQGITPTKLPHPQLPTGVETT